MFQELLGCGSSGGLVLQDLTYQCCNHLGFFCIYVAGLVPLELHLQELVDEGAFGSGESTSSTGSKDYPHPPRHLRVAPVHLLRHLQAHHR
jgi:hypothetical protein